MKTLDDAVIGLGGVWPEGAEVLLTTGDEWSGDVEVSGRIIAGDKRYNDYGYTFMDQSIQGYAIIGSSAWIVLCRMDEFQQRAKELGFINGYRWGVEYENKGDNPPISDGVLIETYSTAGDRWNAGPCSIWNFKARTITAFKITDQRYKPADTSYLVRQAQSLVESIEHKITEVDKRLTQGDWYDYDNQRSLRLPPVGEKVQLKHKRAEQGIAELISYRDDEVVWWNVDGERFQHDKARHYEFKPIDYDRKAKDERKKVVDAAMPVFLDAYKSSSKQGIEALYDAGFLKLPE